MRNASRWTIAALCTSALLTIGCTSDRETSDAKTLVNRVWVDKLPGNDTDLFELLILVDEEPMGLFRRASQYEGSYALFRYELRGDNKVQLLFPQDKSKHEVKYNARACDVKNFDYCLDLEGAPRGAKRYLSRKEWEIDGADLADVERQLAEWRASLSAD